VKEVVDFSDKFGMKYFMCAYYDHDPHARTSSSSSRPAVCSKSMIKNPRGLRYVSLIFIY
jgi:hypothetical protein